MKNLVLTESQTIQNKIYTIRYKQVIIDRDLAFLYGVETKALNQAVKRNEARFPSDFRFQLDDSEKDELVTICDHFKTLKHSSVNPYAFTEQGVSMLSAILKSDIAINMSVEIIRAFVSMRKIINSNNLLFSKIYELEKRQISYEIKTDSKIEIVLNALENKNQKITQTISKQLELDFKKYQKQYKNVELKINKNFHDRFLIIDEKEIYHLGASLKDLGNKVFAFSKFNINSFEFLEKLR
ncbi:ORF6N domain-containing protein [Aliarcobacter cryaerophilus]|uniref:ORF6N domain-containing protein n=1 Tax=Aliarcobacter cryaerophilus TaxID=28198 RepID=UPI0021B590B6|nr:ORF6N domain-containing protein [Aliarcobacter cryaerophilus]MCT7481739.1 ORF6N domain-containing protein [Aliarcobacter cryaerophilus]